MPDYVTPESLIAILGSNNASRFEMTLEQMSAYVGTAKTVIAEGFIWTWQSTGVANGDTIRAASTSKGGVWVRRGQAATGGGTGTVDTEARTASASTQTALTYTTSTLRAGAASVPTGISRIWDEWGSLRVRTTVPGDLTDGGSMFVLGDGRTLERESTVIDVRMYGAKGAFIPAQAWTGSATVPSYLTANNDTEAFQRAINACRLRPGATLFIPRGRYYLGRITGTLQRQLGRRIYGPNVAPYDTGTVFSRDTYEAFSLGIEDVDGLQIQGDGCELYMGTDATAMWWVANSKNVRFTGTGRMYGCRLRADGTRNTENDALVRFGYRTNGATLGEGWHLGAFLGDGVCVGGTATENGGSGIGSEALDVEILASIRERYGDGVRPYAQAQGVAPAPGSRSRLAVAVITAENIFIRSGNIAGGVDIEPNVAGQRAVNVHLDDARLSAARVLPLVSSAHPWQEEQIVPAGTSGSVRLEAFVIYTCPATGAVFQGGGINVGMDAGHIYVHNENLAPITRATFDEAGLVVVGNLGNDINKTTSGAVVMNVTAPTVLPKTFYTETATPFTPTALVTLSGNVRNSTFADITLLDAAKDVIALNSVPNHTGGNTEAGNVYARNKNLGRTGAGRVLAFSLAGTSVERDSLSVAQAPAGPERVLRLDGDGQIDYAATPSSVYAVFNESQLNFLGFKNFAAIPNGARIIIRSQVQGNGLFVPDSGTVLLANGVTAQLRDGSEIEFVKYAGAMREVRRGRVMTTITPIANATTPTDLKLNEVIAVLKSLGYS